MDDMNIKYIRSSCLLFQMYISLMILNMDKNIFIVYLLNCLT